MNIRYYKQGFISEGYFEATVNTPTDSIVNIHRKIYINTIDAKESPYISDGYIESGYYSTPIYKELTELVVGLNISREVGKAFNVLTMDLSGYDIPKEYIRNPNIRLIVELGATDYSFILFDVDTDYRLNSKIIAKSQGCLLDEPFSKNYDDVFLGNSNDILTELTTDIDCAIDVPSFDFNEGSFKLEGSKLDGLNRLSAVSGASIYVVGGKLKITEPLVVDDTFIDFEFNNTILTSKDKSDNFDGSLLIDKVIFNAEDNNLTTEPLITMVYEDGCTRPKFLFNPTPKNIDEITSNLGTAQLTDIRQLYTGSVTNSNSIKVSGGILEIFSITIAGVLVQNSSFELNHNVVLLDNNYTGVVEVTYLTKGISLFTTNGTFNFQDKHRFYELSYLTQKLKAEIPLCANVIKSNGLNDFSITLVNKKITLDTDTLFDIIGDVKNLALVSDKLSGNFDIVNGYYAYGDFDTTFMNTISKQAGVTAEKTFTTSFENVSGLVNGVTNEIYGFFTTPDINISETYVGSTIVSLTKDVSNGNYNLYYTTNSSFSGYNTTATYTAIVDRWTIPSVGGSNLVRFIDWYSEDSIHTFNYPDPTNGTYAGICNLPADIDINVSDLIDIDPRYLNNQKVNYDGVDYTINPIGVIKIHIAKAESIVIDTSALRKGSKITIDSSNSEGGV